MNTRNIIILFVASIYIVSCVHTRNCKSFENYRFDPFQFPYPEYYITADTVHIDSNTTSVSSEDMVTISFFNLTAKLGKRSFDTMVDNSTKGSSLHFFQNKKKRFVIDYNTENRMGCSQEAVYAINKDFCSIVTSTRDYYTYLFTLTPRDLVHDEFASKGFCWVVHQKGVMLRDVEKVRIYIAKDFIAFRRDFSGGLITNLKTEIVIFHSTIEPNWIGIGFADRDEKTITQFLYSLQ